MFILETVMSLLLKPKVSSIFSIKRMTGCFFLALGGGIGFWFLFQFLVPLIGYLQSGALMSAFFLGIGCFLLFWERRKKATCPIAMILGEAQEIFKGVNMEKMLKNNVYKVILVSFIGGIVLSQVKNGKVLEGLKEKLPQLKDLLRRCLK